MDNFIVAVVASFVFFLVLWGWVGTKRIKNLIYILPFLFFFGIINLVLNSFLNIHDHSIIQIYGISTILLSIPLLYNIAKYPFEDSNNKEKIVWFLSLAIVCLIFYNFGAINVEQCLGDGTKISSIRLMTFENYETKLNYYCGIYKLFTVVPPVITILIFLSILTVLMEIISKIIYFLFILIFNVKKMRI